VLTPKRAGSRPLVTVIQPYVPEYRVAFFVELASLLADSGCDLEVVHGAPEGGQADRGDSAVGPWSVPIRVRSLRLRGHLLHYRSVLAKAWRSDVVIAELASTNLDTYLLALLMRRKLMLWGHGKSYVNDTSTLDGRLELWLARRARQVFVYTEGGATYLRSKGYTADRLTVVRNSTDTVTLRLAAAALTDDDVDAFRTELVLGEGPVVAFVGSYDDSKGLPLLFEAAKLVHAQLPGFRLMVAGAGPLQHLVDAAAQDLSFVRSRPRADVAALAQIGRTAQCVVIPGRVGLVAVDALALGLPVVTTTFPYHAPEAEYLSDEVKVVTEQNAADLAATLIDLLLDEKRLETASAAADLLGRQLSVQSMAAAFCGPIGRLLA
jgi:glycosyltransferase involved in cell wall biosynthesis